MCVCVRARVCVFVCVCSRTGIRWGIDVFARSFDDFISMLKDLQVCVSVLIRDLFSIVQLRKSV